MQSSETPLDRVRTVLRNAGSPTEVTVLTKPAPTAATAAEQLGCEVGAIANSVIFSVEGQPLLVVTSGAHRVDTRKVAQLLGVGRKKIRRADPDFVLAATGQAVGGVAPIGHPQPIRTFVDVWLDRHPQVWAGAGVPHALFASTFPELLKLTGGQAAEVGEEVPVVSDS